MSKNELDDLLLRKFQEEDLPYKPASWEKLAQLLPPADGLSKRAYGAGRKNHRIAYGVAAGLALLLGLFLAGRFLMPEETGNGLPVAVRAPQATTRTQVTTPTQVTKPLHATTRPQSTTQPMPHPESSAGLEPRSAASQPVTTTVKAPGRGTNTRAVAETLATAGPQLYDRHEDAATRPEQAGLPEGTDPPPAGDRVWSEREKTAYYNSLLSPSATGAGETAASRTVLSVGGGVNYGTLNTGYALGVSAKHKLGDHFFIEGSLGMLYNNNAHNVADYNTISGFKAAARPSSAGSMKLNAPAISPIENLYYVQVNPALGYEISEQFSLSLGGDLQHLITADAASPTVQYSAEKVRIFPVLDLGLTGKTEFSISPEIQAGILYREGLSAWLKSDPGTAYLNRRYIQVQFKYSLPVGK